MNIEKLNKALAEDIAVFAYRKKDGELRFARGTTNLELIPVESHPKGTGSEKSNTKPYWDLNSNGWRAFNPLCVVWACAKGQELFCEKLTDDEADIISQCIMEMGTKLS